MEDAGYGFGPLFQKNLETESIPGKRTARCIVDLTEPPSTYPQSLYTMHPVCIDGCLQTSAITLWSGNRSSVNAVLIPSIIDDVLICVNDGVTSTGMSLSSSTYVGLGRQEETKNYKTDIAVYSQASGRMLLQVSGLRYHKLEGKENSYAGHKFGLLSWKPDITFLTQDGLSKYLNALANIQDPWKQVQEVIELIIHKNPNLKVREMNMIPNDINSIWLEGRVSGTTTRAGCRKHVFSSIDARALLSTQEKYKPDATSEFNMVDITQSHSGNQSKSGDFDLIIARFVSAFQYLWVIWLIDHQISPCNLAEMIKNCRSMLREGGYFLLVEQPLAGKFISKKARLG